MSLSLKGVPIAAMLFLLPRIGASQGPQGVRFDFQDVELRLVVSALADAGGFNVVYADLPARRVTLRMNQPVARDKIIDLLRSLAASNGLRIVQEGVLLRIEAGAPGQTQAMEQDTAPATELRLFVIRLKHARAAKIAATLQAIFGGRDASLAYRGVTRTPLSESLRGQQIPPMGQERQPDVQVELGPAGGSLPGQLVGNVQIVPDEATNSIIVRADPADWEVIRQTVETLDLRPLQVLIEVLIAEVRRTRDFEAGTSGRVTFKNSGTDAAAELKGQTAGDFALHLMSGGRLSADVVLSALASSGEVRIISRPVLLAQNNQEARILIGSERPFIQVFRSLPTDAGVRDQVVQYRDVGTSVAIVPTINEDGYVNLQIVQEVSTATAETQFGAPIISTREASTHLLARDGQTVVIGGLIDREETKSRSGIPLLKDIPLLGAFFGTVRSSTTRSELFVFLTPHVITSDSDATKVRQGLEQGSELLRPNLPQPLRVSPDSGTRERRP